MVSLRVSTTRCRLHQTKALKPGAELEGALLSSGGRGASSASGQGRNPNTGSWLQPCRCRG